TAGFGGQINFRGYNYVVDFGGIPLEKIPLLYYMDFDTIDLLSLAQELCDIISHELYVTLLPVIDHPACEYLYRNNDELVEKDEGNQIVAGIIRLDAIDKTQQPQYGAIKSYLDNLDRRGINVENQDVGFELSNVTTDKFVVGGQEVDMYYFGTERDRDTLLKTEQIDTDFIRTQSWDVRCQLQQQVLPYYGLLGDKAVTIPKGFGPYQQILLDSRNLNANGVGNYYVATEMELRAALVDFKTWSNFLLSYNDTYVEDIAEHSAFISTLSEENGQINKVVSTFREAANVEGLDDPSAIDDYLNQIKTKQFAVTVPRCVWSTDTKRPMNTDTGQPFNPCSPPYGYPLYYGRARSIGIVQAGIGKIIDAKNQLIKTSAKIKQQYENADAPLASIEPLEARKTNLQRQRFKMESEAGDDQDKIANLKSSAKYKSLIAAIAKATQRIANWGDAKDNYEAQGGIVASINKLTGTEGADGTATKFLYNINKTAQKHEENAQKVYEFVKKIADECLGKKFLVRLPKACNLNFQDKIVTFNTDATNNFKAGPFGFMPRPLSSDPNYLQSPEWSIKLLTYAFSSPATAYDAFHPYLVDDLNELDFDGPDVPIGNRLTEGAMKGNYNPFSESWEWNYKPEPQGGYFTYGQFGRNTTALDFTDLESNWSKLPLSIQQGLCPVDTTNLVSESNRIQCYVKYENSQFLDFAGVDANSMTQQVKSQGGTFAPDVVQELPNVRESKPDLSFSSLDKYKEAQRLNNAPPESTAFVKVDLDEKLYLPPKVVKTEVIVHGEEYELNLTIPEPEVTEAIGPDGCTKEFDFVFPYVTPTFSLPNDGGAGKSVTVDDFQRNRDVSSLKYGEVITEIKELDDEHVYALITVPGRIKSTADIRWRDGPLKAYGAVAKSHMMTQDIVDIPNFNKPNFPQLNADGFRPLCGEPPVFEVPDIFSTENLTQLEAALLEAQTLGLSEAHFRPNSFDYKQNIQNGVPLPVQGWRPGSERDWIQVTLEQVTSARESAKKINRSFALNQPEVSLGYISPSPIFPDLVAMPLMSMERCYGPWLSATQLDPAADARIKYSNIGGKVEFLKREDLAPWNFAGYQLMDQAGSLEANFSNSLLLFSERGGFVIPDAPTGIALATALQQGGPLITNIAISVGTGGVKTTVKMDLYTSQYGKLAKQKEMAISQISRERQKLADTQNAATRRGLGKRSTSADLVNSLSPMSDRIMSQVNANNALQKSNDEFAKEIDEQVIIVGPDGATNMSSKDAQRKLALQDTPEAQAALENNVIISNGTQWSPYSNLPSPNLPSPDPVNNRALNNRTDSRQNPGETQ
ncbi:hypothetical protein OAK92_01115, partial [Crocinitomicaceae bacterium]|nr:hypothetical protein [Crocinitomicaceae bacterium]